MQHRREEFDLVVFDWDGTLVDNSGNIARAFQASFKAHGLPEPDYLAARYVMALDPEEAFRYLAPALSALQIKNMTATYKTRYQFLANTPVLYEGVTLWLPRLNEVGYQLAVATGMSRSKLNEALQKTALATYFAATRTADETFSKPHPQMLNEILSVLGINKHRTLVIGDTVSDLQMAYNAGCAAIAIRYDAHDVSDLQMYKPLQIFDNFHALGAWLVS
jgi:phosphoglycolate phosphatase